MDKKIKLIINADDYGMSPLFNKGILELAEKRIISSLSVMIKKNYLEKEKLEALKNISIGLHLELEEKDSIEEIESQLKSFQEKLGFLPSHLDSHHHMHLTEENLPKTIRVAKKYNLPVRSYLSANRKKIKLAVIRTADGYIDWHPQRIEILEKDFSKLEIPVAEMVCHPGYYDKNSTSPYNERRQQELDFLKSDRFKKMIKNFELINYNEL